MSQLKFEGVGDLEAAHLSLIKKTFQENELEIEFVDVESAGKYQVISFDKSASLNLQNKEVKFYNWDLLFSVLGPNDGPGELRNKLKIRVDILKSISSINKRPLGNEFHGSIRVNNLAASAGFYSWLFGVTPKEWTHRYVTFLRPDTKFNFVLVVNDDKQLNQDTLYHLGMGVSTQGEVIDFYHSAIAHGVDVVKKPFTTWRGTPLHEVWFKDPDGTLIEVYARLNSEELKQMPEDKRPTPLV